MRGSLNRRHELPDRLVARVAARVLDGEEAELAATAALLIDHERRNRRTAAAAQLSVQAIAEAAQCRFAHLVLARAGEDDGRTRGEDVDALKLLDELRSAALEALLQLDEREDDHVDGRLCGHEQLENGQEDGLPPRVLDAQHEPLALLLARLDHEVGRDGRRCLR